VRKGIHNVSFEIDGETYRNQFTIASEKDEAKVLDPFNIKAGIVNLGEIVGTVESVLIEEKDLVVQEKAAVEEKAVAKVDPEAAASLPLSGSAAGDADAIEDFPIFSADEILDLVMIEVYIDETDKTKSQKQKAYRYSIYSEEEVLDQIDEVRYIRNHSSFSEMANNTYQAAYDRESNFEFSGYQWGSVNTAYLSIVTIDGDISAFAKKELYYVK